MKRTPKGFIAVLTVIALLAFSVSLILGVGYRSLDAAQESLALAHGAAALALTDACVEDALLLVKRDAEYSGGVYAYLGGTCQVDVSQDGVTWNMSISATKDGFTRSAQVIFDYTPGSPGTISLRSFQE